jgi:hypothetical protein
MDDYKPDAKAHLRGRYRSHHLPTGRHGMIGFILLVLLVFGVTSTKTTLVLLLGLSVFVWLLKGALRALDEAADVQKTGK